MSAIPASAPQLSADDSKHLDEKVAALTVTDRTINASSSKASESASVAEEATAGAEETPEPCSTETPTGDEVFNLPIAHPLDDCKPATRAELTVDQQNIYDVMLATVKEWTEIPTSTAKTSPKEPITDDERMFLTRDCILRYLRATKWKVDKAIPRLLDTLAWRREYGVNDKVDAELTEKENETGKQVLVGYDIEARPCLYQDPSKQNTDESETQVQHLVYLLERAIDLMPPGQETLTLVINYKNSSMKTNPSMSMSRNVLNILQNYYPERLGRALISDLPWFVTYFFKLITPFIDPVTRTKLRFNEPFDNNIPRSQLLKTWGGEANFVYEHTTYWPALEEFARERRRAYRERWEARGKNVGDDEWILRGGNPNNVEKAED